jgi:hypothetical protein
MADVKLFPRGPGVTTGPLFTLSPDDKHPSTGGFVANDAFAWSHNHSLREGRQVPSELARAFFTGALRLFDTDANHQIFENKRLTHWGDQAVRAFQRSVGIKADGIIGPETMAHLIGHSDDGYAHVLHDFAERLYGNEGLKIPAPDAHGQYSWRDPGIRAVKDVLRLVKTEAGRDDGKIYGANGNQLQPRQVAQIRSALNMLTLDENLTKDDVKGLQRTLNAAGFHVSVNGTLDPQTGRALLRFAFINGIEHQGGH